MGCSKCSGCGKEDITSLNIEERSKLLREITEEIDEMIARGIDSEEVLLKFINLENVLKILKHQLLEKYIDKKVGFEVQQGNLEALEDLMLLIKKLD